MPFKIVGSTSGFVAEVDSTNNLRVVTPIVKDQAGFTRLTNGLYGVNVGDGGRLSVGSDTPLLYEDVNGASLNTNNWITANTTMTIAVASAFIVLNSAAITTLSTHCNITSIKQIHQFTDFATTLRWLAKTPNVPQTNATMEMGMGFVATTGAPTSSGAFFRWSIDGLFYACVMWSGTELKTSIAIPSINTVHSFEIKVGHGGVDFYVDDVYMTTVSPAANAVPMVPTRIPLFARVYTAASAPAVAPQLFISMAVANLSNMNAGRTWHGTLACLGQGHPTNPVTTFSQLTQWANGAQPSTITPANAASTAYTTPGGLYVMTALAASVTDVAVFAFLVPTGYQMIIKGIWITINNGVVAVATSATILEWFLAVNSSALTMATADGTNTWQPRRVPVGVQSFAIAAAVGAEGREIQRTFEVPVICESGRYVHVGFKPLSGTATATELFNGMVGIDYVFE